MQTRDNLERMVVIKAFIAVRMLGLRQEGISEETQNDSCKKILTPTEWKRKRLVRTVLIFTESSDQLSRATDRVPGLPASPGYAQ